MKRGCSRPVLVLLLLLPPGIGLSEDRRGAAAPTPGLVFAHLVAGGGYSTTFTLNNPGGEPATGSLVVTDQSGQPLSVTWRGSASAVGASVPVLLPPGATAILTALRPGSQEFTSGWARIEGGTGTLGGVASFQLGDGGGLKSIAGVLAAPLVSAAAVPVDNDEASGRFAGFALANPGPGIVRVLITPVRQDGTILDPIIPAEMNPLGALSQVARFLHEYRPSLSTFRGSMIVSTQGDEPVALVALNVNQGLFTAIPVIPRKPMWRVVWNDEFNGADGSGPDPGRWAYDTGGGGWGNSEAEYYTSRLDNAYIEGGNLVIKASRESFGNRSYTSARLKTQGKFAQKYGRIEARLRLPYGQGIWPAFWMLGNDIESAGWPACGEIDIMENIGKERSRIYGTIHGPGYSGANGLGTFWDLPGGQVFSDDFHVFAVEWDPDAIRWYVDGNLYLTRKPTDLPGGTRWVFDHPFFIIVNVAVGGTWPGYPDDTTVFPQKMLVDYVRVYERVP